jgi:hypothetical protein
MRKQENLKKREHSLTTRVDDQSLQSKMATEVGSIHGSNSSTVSSIKDGQTSKQVIEDLITSALQMTFWH